MTPGRLPAASIQAMRAEPRGSSWRFLLQPWRYDFEYSRAWREKHFPLYGVVQPQPRSSRMGGKGRGGRVPTGPARHLPAYFWTKLTHLGVLEEGSDWMIEISTHVAPPGLPPAMLEIECRHHAEHGMYATGSHEGSVTAASHDLVVDEVPLRFDGVSLDAIWVGSARTSVATIRVVASNTDPSEIVLAQIDDPTCYLRGQRAFMRI